MLLRTSLVLIAFLFSIASFAKGKIVAVVSSVKGKAFYTYEGKTKTITAGMHLPRQAEIFTDLGGQLSINDYYDHIYHLAGGGHMILHTNLVELKEGYLWVKSLNYDPIKGPLRVTTSNAIVEHQVGEGIVSFDVYTGKTQVLAVDGGVDFKNIRQEYYHLALSEGQFSFISDEHENGRPRKPTPIGYSSFQKVTGLFKGVEPKQQEAQTPKVAKPVQTYAAKAPSKVKTNDSFEAALQQRKAGRGIASAESEKGKITVIKLHDPQDDKKKEKSLMNYYSEKIAELKPVPKPKKKWTPTYQKKSGVAVHVFGLGKKKSRVPASVRAAKPKAKKRTPASVGGMTPQINNSAFEGELLRQYKKQMRHDQEVNELIDQLKSIDMDYKKDY